MADSAATESRLDGIANSLHQAVEDAMVLREEAAPNDGLAAGLVSTLAHILAEIRELSPPSLHPEAESRAADFKERGIPICVPVHARGGCPACDAFRLLGAAEKLVKP